MGSLVVLSFTPYELRVRRVPLGPVKLSARHGILERREMLAFQKVIKCRRREVDAGSSISHGAILAVAGHDRV
jgi:hypothetical protein